VSGDECIEKVTAKCGCQIGRRGEISGRRTEQELFQLYRESGVVLIQDLFVDSGRGDMWFATAMSEVERPWSFLVFFYLTALSDKKGTHWPTETIHYSQLQRSIFNAHLGPGNSISEWLTSLLSVNLETNTYLVDS
jgi:hypothetical protein